MYLNQWGEIEQILRTINFQPYNPGMLHIHAIAGDEIQEDQVNEKAIDDITTLRYNIENDDLESLQEWLDQKYEPYTVNMDGHDEWYDPNKGVLSVAAAIDLCRRYRESLKLPIQILKNNIQSSTDLIESINMNDYYKKSEVDNLLQAYDNRIKALEAKCANIE